MSLKTPEFTHSRMFFRIDCLNFAIKCLTLVLVLKCIAIILKIPYQCTDSTAICTLILLDVFFTFTLRTVDNFICLQKKNPDKHNPTWVLETFDFVGDLIETWSL